MKRALVIGSRGQDGRLLTEALEARGVVVIGIDRDDGVDLGDALAVRRLVERADAEATFYLAAHHHSSEGAFDDVTGIWEASLLVNVRGLVAVLEAVRTSESPRVRGGHLFYASSSHVFGSPPVAPQDETTPLEPRTPYAISKVAAMAACRAYRESKGVRASTGILYNHESRWRGPGFVSSKIVQGARDVKAGRARAIALGRLSAVVDWGYAPDYVDAMIRMVLADSPDDYVVATGRLHTVRDFCEIAFRAVGLDYRSYVEEEPSIVTRAGTLGPAGFGAPVPLVGNAKKLEERTGWHPTVTFEEMVVRLVTDPLG